MESSGSYRITPCNHKFYILFFTSFYTFYSIYMFNVIYRYQHFWYRYINISPDINIFWYFFDHHLGILQCISEITCAYCLWLPYIRLWKFYPIENYLAWDCRYCLSLEDCVFRPEMLGRNATLIRSIVLHPYE